MLIRIQYRNTLDAISRLSKRQNKDKESQELLNLIVLSVFCDEVEYRSQRLDQRITKYLEDLSLNEKNLDGVYCILFEETLTYLPKFKPHLPQHCIPLSCIQKTSTDTFTICLKEPHRMHLSYWTQ